MGIVRALVTAAITAPLVLGAGPATAQPAAPKAPKARALRVAIVPGIAVNLDAARVDALSQDLAEALAAELDIEVIGGLEVRRRLPVDGLPPDCVAKRACFSDVARRLDVEQLLFVVMVDTGTAGAVQIDSTWIDAATGTTTSRPALDIASGSEARARFTAAARQLLPDAPVRPKPAGGIGGVMSAPVPRHVTLPAYFTAGAALVGVGLGVGFGLSARTQYRDCDDAPALCTEDRRDRIRTRALIADIGWVVGASGAIATAVLFATSGKESRLVVEPAPNGVSAAVVGRF